MPENTGEFAARVEALGARIQALQRRLVDTEARQNTYLAQLAAHELEQQKDRLAAYQMQARFALATMYDRAASSEAAHPKGSPPKASDEAPAGAPAATPAPDATPAAPPTPEPPR